MASNEIFSLSIKIIFIIVIYIISILLIILFIDKIILIFNSINNEIISITDIKSFFSENSLNLNKLYNYPTNIITIILINYLLITLIVTVKITKLFYGPLRIIN